MGNSLLRAVRITLSPGAEWQLIAAEAPEPRRILVSFILPLALIPALSWCIGLYLYREGPSAELAQIAYRGAIAYAGSLASIALLAACIVALAPLFETRRNWARAFQVAAYGSAPVMLAGLVLVIPDLAFATLLGAFQSFFLLYVGLVQVLAVKEDRAAEYLALVIVALTVASTFLGAAGSAAGLL